jgi:hypothetical protein
MAYFIYCREGASTLVFKRDTKLAAEKKAAEMRDAGYPEVSVVEQPAPKVVA